MSHSYYSKQLYKWAMFMLRNLSAALTIFSLIVMCLAFCHIIKSDSKIEEIAEGMVSNKVGIPVKLPSE